MTKNERTRLNAVMMSSTTPSAKYSCSGSPPNVGERQDRDGRLVGERQRRWIGPAVPGSCARALCRTPPHRRGPARRCASRPAARGRGSGAAGLCARARAPRPTRRRRPAVPGPGDARRCSRHLRTDRLPRTMTSPACTPMRNSSRRSAGSLALAFASRSCVSTAQLHGIHRARELGQHAIAGGVDDAAAVLGDDAVHDLPPLGQAAERADLIQSHQPSVARHVRRQYGSELARNSLVRIGHDRQCLWTSGCLSWSAGLHSAGRGISKGAKHAHLVMRLPWTRRWDNNANSGWQETAERKARREPQ